MEALTQDLIHDDENAMAMIADLKKQLEKVTKKNEVLEEECDLLAMENDRLRTLCQSHGVDPDHTGGGERSSDVPEKRSQEIDEEKAEFLINAGGDGNFACKVGSELLNACGSGNALCLEYVYFSGQIDENSIGGNYSQYVVCGGVDKTLRLYSIMSSKVLFEHAFSAPILAIDVTGSLIACSMMDGSHGVIDLRVNGYANLESELCPAVIQSDRDHTKYVVSVKWSPDGGQYLVTASHDKSVILYRREEESGKMIIKHKLDLKESPEDVIFCYLPDRFTSDILSDRDGGIESCFVDTPADIDANAVLHIIVPVRGASYLLYINCDNLKHRKVSLNENLWDSHVSFNVLHLSLAPTGRSLLVATDKDFHIILKLGTNKRFMLLAGHMCNDYGKPKTAWDVTGKYVYSNNQADFNILVYAVNTGKIVKTLTGHRGQIRDIKSHPVSRTILSASYDHTIKEWVNDVASNVN